MASSSNKLKTTDSGLWGFNRDLKLIVRGSICDLLYGLEASPRVAHKKYVQSTWTPGSMFIMRYI